MNRREPFSPEFCGLEQIFPDASHDYEIHHSNGWSMSLDLRAARFRVGQRPPLYAMGLVMRANQRQFARLPMLGDDASAQLIIKRRKIPCRLVEMSIGGFGVLAPKDTRVEKDELACLRTRGSDFIVQITYQELQHDGVSLGLKQVEEVPPPSNQTIKAPRWMTAAFLMAAAGSILIASLWLSGMYEALPIEIRPMR
jgi:hypothetical protein